MALLSPLVIAILVVLAVILLTIVGASAVDVFIRRYQIESWEDVKALLRPKNRSLFAELRGERQEQIQAASAADRVLERFDQAATKEAAEPESLGDQILRARTQEGDEHDEIKDNFLGRIAKSKTFENTTMAVITLNALMLGWDADYTSRFKKPIVHVGSIEYEGPWFFVMIEYMFAVYFTSEILIRFLAYKKCISCCTSGWFIFDSILVTMMVMDTWVLPLAGVGGALNQLSALRLVRLIRVTRLVRLMRAFPEMMMIVNGMFTAVRSVFWTGILMTLLVFTFSIMFTNEFHQGPIDDSEVTDDAQAYFGSMGKCMLTLFILGSILDDVTAACDAIRATGNTAMLGVFMVFIVMSSFMMLNLLVGIMAEVVMTTADAEKEKRQTESIHEAIFSAISKLDNDKSGMVTKAEYLAIRGDEELKEALDELEVKEKHFYMFAELLFQEDENEGGEPELSVEEVIDLILRLRPGNALAKLDFAAMAGELAHRRRYVERWVEHIEMQVEEVMRIRGVAPPPLSGPTLAHKYAKSQSMLSGTTGASGPSEASAESLAGSGGSPRVKGAKKRKNKAAGEEGGLRAAGAGDSPSSPAFLKAFSELPKKEQPLDKRFSDSHVDDDFIVQELQRRFKTGDDGRCLTTGSMQSASIVEVTDVEELYDIESVSSEGRDPFAGSRLDAENFEEMSC